MQNGINQRTGVHIVIENTTKTPSIVSKGISVMPGMETNIGLQTTKILRLKEPFKSNCTDDYLDGNMKTIQGLTFAYSSRNCKGMCYVLKTYDSCKCIHPMLVEGFKIEDYFGRGPLVKIRICNITEDSNDSKCIGTLALDDIGDANICDCNSECVEGKYKVTNLQ